jgi:hypothetical protein
VVRRGRHKGKSKSRHDKIKIDISDFWNIRGLNKTGVTEPPEKAGVYLSGSYRGILDEARIHKHNT